MVDVVDDLLEPQLVGLVGYDEEVLVRHRLLPDEIGSQHLAGQEFVQLKLGICVMD